MKKGILVVLLVVSMMIVFSGCTEPVKTIKQVEFINSSYHNSKVVLTWSYSENFTEFEIYRKNGNAYTLLGSTKELKFEDINLPDSEYCDYAIKAVSNNIKSDYMIVKVYTPFSNISGDYHLDINISNTSDISINSYNGKIVIKQSAGAITGYIVNESKNIPITGKMERDGKYLFSWFSDDYAIEFQHKGFINGRFPYGDFYGISKGIKYYLGRWGTSDSKTTEKNNQLIKNCF